MTAVYVDPCTTALELRAAYLMLIKGGGAQRIVIEGGGGKRDVTFAKGNIEALRYEMRAAEAACAALTDPGGKPRRYAIRAGARSRGGSFGL
jgi:hypothetical protein